MFQRTKIATGALAGVLTLSLTGAAALAAFHPTDTTAAGSGRVDAGVSVAAAERGKGVEVLKDVLARLVASGTITAEQQAKILEAVRTAAQRPAAKRPDAPGQLKRIYGRFMELSIEYLGLEKSEVGAALRAGTSLGALATATDGKTRDDLILFLVVEASFLIDQAVADGRITEESAAEARVGLTERVTAFVDHVYELRGGKDLRERAKERVKERVKELKDRSKERREERKADREAGDEDSGDETDEDDQDSGDEDDEGGSEDE